MPETAEKIAKQIGAPLVDFELLEKNAALSDEEKAEASVYYPERNQVTDAPEILFARQDLNDILEKVEAMFAERRKEAGQTEEKTEEKEEVIDVEAKPEITYDVFDQCQFRVGRILECKEVPKSKKLLCSQVQIGSEVKQILSGIKQHYSAEEMVGKKVMVLVNLKPAKLAGVLSEGMLLCAEDAEGNLALMTPEKAMPAGAEIC